MILAFRMGPTFSGRGLCDSNRELSRVTKSCARKLTRSGAAEIYRLLVFLDFNYNRYIFAVPGLPSFLTRDLVTLDIDITQSPSTGCRTHTKCRKHGIVTMGLGTGPRPS